MGGSFGGTIGRIGLGAVGFGLGSMVGMPALGASLGMSLGGMLFPPKQESKTRHIKAVLGSSSVEGTPLAIVFGRVRIGGTLLWKGDLVYHEIKKKKGKGGGSSVITDQWYTVSFAMVIGEGEMSLQRIYDGKNIVSPAYTFYEGTPGQLADGFLTTQTGKSIPYKHTAYIVFQDYRVGMTPQIPQLTFEVVSGQSKFDVSLTLTDAWGTTYNKTKYNYVTVADLQNCITPAFAINALIKNDRFGGGFKKNCDWLDAHSDCIDKSYFFNLALTERRDLASLIEMISAHGWIINIFSGSDIRLLLASDETPSKSYFLDDMAGKVHESVIDVSESGRSERFNRVSIEYTDPKKEYSTRPIQVEDLADQQDRGVMKNNISLPGFTDPDIAKEVGSIMMRNSLFGRRMVQFTLGPKELETEIGDVCYLSAYGVGLTLTRCRIFGVDETEEFNLAITAREEPNYIFDPNDFDVPASYADPAVDTNVGLSNAIGFNMHEVPKEALLNAGSVEIMPIYKRQHKDTVGINLYYSLDDTEYNLLHVDKHPALGGIAGHTQAEDKFLNQGFGRGLEVDTAFGNNDGGDDLDSMSRATVMSTKNLSLIDDELMLFQNSSLGTTQLYTLTDFVRGRYNTKVQHHASGSDFFMIDDGERIEFLKNQIGVKYYFKAVPYNTYSMELDISEVTSVGLTIQGWAFRPYAPGNIWMEDENGVSMRGLSQTGQTNITLAWNNCSKNIGFGTFPYNTREYGDYLNDGDITGHEIEIYTPDYSSDYTLNLHLNGAEGGTTFIDNGYAQRTVTSVNGASTTTLESKFGGSSGYFINASQQTLTVPASDDWNFGSGDFTVHGFINWKNWHNATGFITTGVVGTKFGWQLWKNSDRLKFVINGGWPIITTGTQLLTEENVWYHVAVTRSGNNWKTYIDGVVVGTYGGGDTIADQSAPLILGQGFGGSGWPPSWSASADQFMDGWMDEWKVIKGEALWDGPFTPPTKEEPFQFGLARTATTVGATHTYTYTEAENIEDNGSLATEMDFKVYTKSIYGRSRHSADKSIEIK
jgi:hypothetical protein